MLVAVNREVVEGVFAFAVAVVFALVDNRIKRVFEVTYDFRCRTTTERTLNATHGFTETLSTTLFAARSGTVISLRLICLCILSCGVIAHVNGHMASLLLI